ncbi:hypothetical protein PG997_009158 [Apiospora hydei]|uniref:F-box domain-containing protein n=1 Tax=Apiospora hydei TaxID=1337664 RepID=A0ABR1VWF7_9PEZI
MATPPPAIESDNFLQGLVNGGSHKKLCGPIKKSLAETNAFNDTPIPDFDVTQIPDFDVTQVSTEFKMPYDHPPKSNILCTLPTELILEVATYLDCVEQNSLLKTCRDLHALLNPGLRNVRDKHGNDRYLFWLFKTGNVNKLAAHTGPLCSTLFTLEGDLLASYVKNTRPAVQKRMDVLRQTSSQYPCLRIDKSGLMVAIDYLQWELVVFLLQRDGAAAAAGFLGSKEHFWKADATAATAPAAEREAAPIVVSHPPIWEYFNQPEQRWNGSLYQTTDALFLGRLLVLAKNEVEARRAYYTALRKATIA